VIRKPLGIGTRMASMTKNFSHFYLLFLSSAAATLSTLTKMLCTFVSIPWILNSVGKENYGFWMTAVGFVAFLGFSDLGLIPALKNRMIEALASNDLSLFKYYYRLGFYLLCCFLFLSGLLCISVFAFDLSRLLNLPNSLSETHSQLLICVLIVAIFLNIGLNCVDSFYASKMTLYRLKWLEIGFQIFGTILLYWASKNQVSVPVLAMISLSPVLILRCFILIWHLLKKQLTIVGFSKKDLNEIVSLLKISPYFLTIQILGTCYFSLPIIMVSRYSSLSETADFSVIFRLFNIPVTLVQSLLPVFWSPFRTKWLQGEFRTCRSMLFFTSGLSLSGSGLFGLVILNFHVPLFELWKVNQIYFDSAVSHRLFFWMMFQCASFWYQVFLGSIEDLKFSTWVQMISVLLFLGLCYSWSSERSHGVAGALAVNSVLVWFLLYFGRSVFVIANKIKEISVT
jgi:O-antigen/teichoic acid export membrane protein